jgi:signal transduction histidine kinase
VFIGGVVGDCGRAGNRPQDRFCQLRVVLLADAQPPCPPRSLALVRRRFGIGLSAPRATAAALVAVLAAMVVADSAITADYHRGWLFELVVGALVAALVIRGRGIPGIAAGVGLAGCAVAGVIADVSGLPSQPGVAATIGLLVLGAACARGAAGRRVALVGAAGIVVMVSGRLALRPAWAFALSFLGILVWMCAIGVGLWLRVFDARRRDMINAARRRVRVELARELHDVVAHHVAGIVVQAQAARVVATRHPENLQHTLTTIESAGGEALSAMRRVVGLLRDDNAPGSPQAPSVEEVRELVSRFADHGPAVELHLPASPDELSWPPEVASTVHRIVQEALTNVVRHAAEATAVTVAITDEESMVSVEVSNDGQQRRPATRRDGYGLLGMHERVHALGGTFHAGPRTAGGWTVRASIPVLEMTAR